MRTQTYEQMLPEYDFQDGLDPDDAEEREKLLLQYPYSVIVEGAFMEIDSLQRWIDEHLPTPPPSMFYSKTGYDFGFWEFFSADPDIARRLGEVVPLIYTVFPMAFPSPLTVRTNSYDEWIDHDPQDPTAIVYKPD